MRKLFLVLAAVVALTAASKVMVVWAEETAMEATETAMVESTNMVSNEVMNDMNAMSNEAMMEVNEMGNAAAPEAGSTY
jgi:hypothetical protein